MPTYVWSIHKITLNAMRCREYLKVTKVENLGTKYSVLNSAYSPDSNGVVYVILMLSEESVQCYISACNVECDSVTASKTAHA